MQVRNISLADIVPSELNPRKSFNQEELEELAQSIKENGLVQPITLRKIGTKKSSKYEIVCGERRFRACQLLGMTDIQAIVKDLNDKQAFACMIIENLQRKDIDPMEEAAALNKLFSEGSMTVKEMAQMLGKSTSFVFGRIQLYNTIPEFVDLMRNGPLVLTHLLDICKLTKEQQEILYKECFTEECRARWTYKFPNMPQLHEMIDEHVMNYIADTKFELSDESFDFAPACENCPLNTRNNPDNFSDVNRPRCMKRECFMRKTMESIFRTAKSLDNVQLVYEGDYPENETILKAAEAYGLEVVGIGHRTYVMEPVEPLESAFNDKETYECRKANYDKVRAVFDDNLKDGTITPVYEICYGGHLSGELKYVFCAPDSGEEPLVTRQVEDGRRCITELKTKLHECGEKYREEMTEKQRVFMEHSEYSRLNTELSATEMQILFALLMKRLPTAFKESIGCSTDQSNDFHKAKEIFDGNANAIMREFIRVTLSEKSVNFSRDLSNMLNSLMEERYGSQVADIAKGLDSRYDQLKINLKAKIDEIRQSEKADEPKVSEQTAPTDETAESDTDEQKPEESAPQVAPEEVTEEELEDPNDGVEFTE